MRIPLLIITGPIGVGKTSVVAEIAESLNALEIPCAAVDMDWLASYFPRPPTDPFGTTVGIRNLADAWHNFRVAGAGRLVIACIVATRRDVRPYHDAVPGSSITVCRLRAPIRLLEARVAQREQGSALEWHLKRSAEMVELFERGDAADFVIDVDDRDVHEIATHVLQRSGWVRPEAAAQSSAPL